jgi:hypothetical protein
MRVQIEIDTSNDAFEEDPYGEFVRIMDTVSAKVHRILARAPGCICTAPEVDDKIMDLNGNTVGSITITE